MSKVNYKATFILDTRGREESAEQLVDSVKDEIVSVGGEMSDAENVGRQDFARAADQRYVSGIYATYSFSGSSDVPSKILEKLRLNKLVSHKIIQRA